MRNKDEKMCVILFGATEKVINFHSHIDFHLQFLFNFLFPYFSFLISYFTCCIVQLVGALDIS